MQGDAQLEKGEYQLATKSYSKAMELDPSSAVIPASKAKALFQQQLWVYNNNIMHVRYMVKLRSNNKHLRVLLYES